MSYQYPIIKPVTENSILVEYEEEIRPEVNAKIRQLELCIDKHRFPGLAELVPAYRSLMIFFDPFAVDLNSVCEIVAKLVKVAKGFELPKARRFAIPTIYGGNYGPDLVRISEITKMEPEEVVRIFSSGTYLVYCLGFLCGLAYLGGVPEILNVPRLVSPRARVSVGSVGFSGHQANILPIEQPSGFNYIGRTFVRLYDPDKFPPTSFRAGDLVQCSSVSEEEARMAEGKHLEDFLESL